MKKIYYSLLLSVMATGAFAQVPFWTENFGTGCSQGNYANGFNPGQGVWTVSLTGTNDTYANKWFISATEAGMGIGNCGDGCNGGGSTNRTLHVGYDFPPLSLIDDGAAYLAGAGANSNMRIQSPVINCTGQNTISLKFAYILQGTVNADYFDVQYSANGGSTWSTIATPPPTNNGGCGGQGLWTGYTVALPATANNNANVKIGFRWQNTDPNGYDPSAAIDDVSLFTTAPATFAPTFTISSPICSGKSQTLTANTGTFAVSGYTWSTSPVGPTFATPNASVTTVTYPTAGTFSITLTATSGGTTQSMTNTILVNATPVLTPSASPASICTGQSTTLTANGANTYSWLPGPLTGSNVVVTPSMTTTYTLTGASVAGCTTTATVAISVGSALNVSLTASPSTICIGTSATLSATGGTAYTWNPGSLSGSSVVVSPTANVTYTANAVNGACTGSNVITLTVVACSTGLNAYTLNTSYRAYPNPVADKLYIESNGSSSTVNVEVVDALGKVVLKQSHTFGATPCIVNVSAMPAGIYFVKLTSASEIKAIRFVKE